MKSTIDSAIPSGNSVAYSALSSLKSAASSNNDALGLTRKLAKLSEFVSGDVAKHPGGHTYLLTALSNEQHGVVDTLHRAASNKVSIRSSTKILSSNTLSMALTIDVDDELQLTLFSSNRSDGNKFPVDLNIPEDVSGIEIVDVDWQASFSAKAEVSNEFVYGKQSLEVTLRTEGPPGMLSLSLQACNADHCLPTAKVLIPVPANS